MCKQAVDQALSTNKLQYVFAAYGVGETLSIGVCSLTTAHAHDLFNSETKLYFPSVFCCVFYNKFELFFYDHSEGTWIFVMLLTCTALPPHSDQFDIP